MTFFADAEAARAAGFRACKRCRPGDEAVRRERAALVASLCQRLRDDEPSPSLSDLAHMAKMTPERVRRLFVAVLGVTPRAFLAATRMERASEAMQRGASVTAAMHAAGYSSSSGFHRDSRARLGMLPKQHRKGGVGVQMKFAVRKCSLGLALVATTARGLCAVLLGDDEDELQAELAARFPNASRLRGGEEHDAAVTAVLAVVDGQCHDVHVPFDVRGTAFQQLVWQELRRVVAGETVNYSELAKRIGKPAATRAVAAACAANPLAVLVPCHRVLRKDGSLSGYRWGVHRKRALLDREGASPSG